MSERSLLLNVGSNDAVDVTKEDNMSIIRMMAMTSSLIGIQFSYAVEFAFVTPQLAELGVPTAAIPVIWLAGPLSGFIVQPIVGVFSDRCESKFGRRRPFIFAGAIFTIVGMILLAGANTLGKWISSGNWQEVAIISTILGLYVMNFAINVMQGPARSLVGDLIPNDQQQFANSLCSFMMGVANFVAYFLGSRDIKTIFPFFPSNYVAMFSLGIIFLVIGVVPTLLFSNEIQLTHEDALEGEKKSVNFIKELLIAARNMPAPLLRVAIVYFFCWMAFFPFQIFITDFFGREVYHGDPSANKHSHSYHEYEEGVREGSFGLMLMSGVTLLFSPLQTRIMELIGIRPMWIISELIAAVCFILPLWLYTRDAALSFTAVVGVNFTSFNSIPFALLKKTVNDEEIGVYMAMLNAFCVVAQTVANFLAGSVAIPLFHRTAAGLATGGVFAVVAAGLVLILRMRDYEDKEEKKPLISRQ